jgi:hypothetical protein
MDASVALHNVFPNSVVLDFVNQMFSHAVLICKCLFTTGRCANRSDGILIEFSHSIPYSLGLTIPRNHIGRILGMGAFDNMPLIAAQTNIAGVAGAWLRHSSMHQKEHQSVYYDCSGVRFDFSVPVKISAERPQEAFVTAVKTDGSSQPFILIWLKSACGGDGVVAFDMLTGMHLVSLIGKVFGRTRCSNSGSPFILTQGALA